MDPGGGGFHRNVVYNDDDVAREFQPANVRRSDLPPRMPPPLHQWQPRPVVAPRPTVAPPPPPPAPAGRPEQISTGRGAASGTTLFVGDLPLPMPPPLHQWQPRLVVAPRLTVAPPPPPPAPAGRPEQISTGRGAASGTTLFVGDLPPPMPPPLHQWQPRPVVAPRLTVAPPPPPPAPAGTTLFVGDLHWWTTDAEIEAELCKYGQVKEVKYFDDGLCGKSKGFCQVDFYDPIAAAACEEGMNGHIFDGRPCVVSLASPQLVQTMGERQMNKNGQMTGAPEPPAPPQKGIGSWGRGGGRMGNRAPVPVHVPPPPVFHPGAMICQGFNPMGYGAAAMGGMAAGGAPFPGMMPPFPPIVAPHFNPAFFGRWPAPAGVGNMGGRGGQEQSSYRETSHVKSRMAERDQYGRGSGRQNLPESKHHDERERDSGRQKEMNWERDRERQRERNRDRDWEKEQRRQSP